MVSVRPCSRLPSSRRTNWFQIWSNGLAGGTTGTAPHGCWKSTGQVGEVFGIWKGHFLKLGVVNAHRIEHRLERQAEKSGDIQEYMIQHDATCYTCRSKWFSGNQVNSWVTLFPFLARAVTSRAPHGRLPRGFLCWGAIALNLTTHLTCSWHVLSCIFISCLSFDLSLFRLLPSPFVLEHLSEACLWQLLLLASNGIGGSSFSALAALTPKLRWSLFFVPGWSLPLMLGPWKRTPVPGRYVSTSDFCFGVWEFSAPDWKISSGINTWETREWGSARQRLLADFSLAFFSSLDMTSLDRFLQNFTKGLNCQKTHEKCKSSWR